MPFPGTFWRNSLCLYLRSSRTLTFSVSTCFYCLNDKGQQPWAVSQLDLRAGDGCAHRMEASLSSLESSEQNEGLEPAHLMGKERPLLSFDLPSVSPPHIFYWATELGPRCGGSYIYLFKYNTSGFLLSPVDLQGEEAISRHGMLQSKLRSIA